MRKEVLKKLAKGKQGGFQSRYVLFGIATGYDIFQKKENIPMRNYKFMSWVWGKLREYKKENGFHENMPLWSQSHFHKFLINKISGKI
jgi:hypothetical protein